MIQTATPNELRTRRYASPAAAPARPPARSFPTNEQVGEWTRWLHDEVTGFFRAADGGGAFHEERWTRPGGGGGVSRLMEQGVTWEKAGVNWSAVDGELPASMVERLGGRLAGTDRVRFFATGVSVVAHPWSPMVPTIHLNVRFFALEDADGRRIDCWFGGGADLTPTYPLPEDAEHFHRTLRDVCDRSDSAFYGRFKPWCDEYFTNRHRGGEARGIGGIFFDNLRPEPEEGLGVSTLLHFVEDVALALPEAYGTIVERRRRVPYGQRERSFQLARRGRYVEFNLVHDKGTLFGLQTDARIESVLMSMPPMASWSGAAAYEPGSFEARLLEMLPPRDWAGSTTRG